VLLEKEYPKKTFPLVGIWALAATTIELHTNRTATILNKCISSDLELEIQTLWRQGLDAS
jgi:hypothetical protein